MFVINNIGGNLPILVDPLAKHIGYRASISIFYAGFYLVSSILFFITMYFMEGKKEEEKPIEPVNAVDPSNNVSRVHVGIDNRSYVPDNMTMQHLSGRTSDKNYY